MSAIKVHFSSATDNWATPREVYEALDQEFHFDFDPCPYSEIAPKKTLPLLSGIESVEEKGGVNGLEIEWGNSNFVNPPYSALAEWAQKGFEESQKGKIVVFLVPSRTDTKYWHDYFMKADEIRFCRGRLKFGDSDNSAPFPSAIIVFKGASHQHGGPTK